MATVAETIRAELADIVGETQVTAEESARAAFAVDGLEPDWVVSPSSGEQAAAALKCAAQRDLDA